MEKVLRNINLLRSFECAARHCSYSKAADELCISQAAVSQQMRQLEAAVGTRLFLRKGRQMLLTSQGQILFEAAQQALDILKKGLAALHSDEVAGELTITSTQAFAALWLMPRLQQFSALHPDIEVRVIPSPHFEDLRQQSIDLAVRFGTGEPAVAGQGLACEYFGEDPVYPVCSPELASSMAFSEPADLLSTRLVGLEHPGPFDWPAWFEQAGVSDYRRHRQWTRVSSTDMALNAVMSGHGVTLAAHYLYAERLAAGRLVIPVDIPHPQVVKRYFVYDPEGPKQARLRTFMTWLSAAMGSP